LLFFLLKNFCVRKNRNPEIFKDWFLLIFGYFNYQKDKQLDGYFVSIKEVLSFPLIPPMTTTQTISARMTFGI